MSIFCIVFVKAIPGNPCSSQALHLLLCKMHADRNLDKKQALNFLLDTLLFAKSLFLHKISNRESAHFAISYNICYIFVYTLYNLNEKEE